jgi:trehalose 2-sulfotransferase
MRNYLLCTVPRSGSWLLADLLEQTEVAGRPEEYFRPDHRKFWCDEWGIPRKSPFDRFLGAALANAASDNGVFGAKLHWYQLEWFASELRALPGADQKVTDEALVAHWFTRPRCVYLYREDKIRQAISYYRASYTDVWFELADEGSGTIEERYRRPVPMPEETDWGYVRHLENGLIQQERLWGEFFARAGIVPLEVRYEDMVLAHEETLKRVLDFIGVELPPDAPPPVSRLKKQADETTERLVQEYLAHRGSVEPRNAKVDDERRRVLPQFPGDALGPRAMQPVPAEDDRRVGGPEGPHKAVQSHLNRGEHVEESRTAEDHQRGRERHDQRQRHGALPQHRDPAQR